MDVLILSFMFPPANVIGAVRVGKMANELVRLGHTVRVVCAAAPPCSADLAIATLPETHIVRTRWLDIAFPMTLMQRLRAHGGTLSQQLAAQPRSTPLRAVFERLLWCYRLVFSVPDDALGWLPFAVRAAEQAIAARRPDLIYASGGPFTALIAAAVVHQRSGVPWVAELRDLWADNHYYPYPLARRAVDAAIERQTLRSAATLVTVSDPLAQTLRDRYPMPVAVITNGFDPADYPGPRTIVDDDILRLVYTGTIYPGRQDAGPLFAALATLGPAAERVRVIAYGYGTQALLASAAAVGLSHLVELRGHVAHHTALAAQRDADVLLLLRWNDATDRGVLTGKLFEYLGARRPIIAPGSVDDAAARLIRARAAGVASSSVAELTQQVKLWLMQREQGGSIADLPLAASAGLTRAAQAAHLAQIFAETLTRQSAGET